MEALPERDRLLALQVQLDAAGSEVVRDARERRIVEGRIEALIALECAYAALGLDTTTALKVREFNAVCREEGIHATASRVGRAWGTWAIAVAVYRGERPADRYGYLAVQQFVRRWSPTRRDSWMSLREWLSEPGVSKNPNARAYDTWASAQNAAMPSDELPHRTAYSISNAVSMRFPQAVRAVLNGEDQTRIPERVAEETITVGGKTLITMIGIGALMGWTQTRVNLHARDDADDGLPPRAARIGSFSLWQLEHIEAYRDRRQVVAERDHAQHLLYDATRLGERLGRNVGAVRTALHRRSPTVPRPTAILNHVPWWDAAEVDGWLEAHPEHDPIAREHENRERIEQNTLVAGGHALLTSEGAMRTLGLSSSTWTLRRSAGELPEPCAKIGNMPLWLRSDIERTDSGEPVEREAGELQYLLLDSHQLAQELSLSRDQFGDRMRAGSDEIPPPNGQVNNFYWWDAAEVAAWRARRTSRPRNTRNIGDKPQAAQIRPSDGRSN